MIGQLIDNKDNNHDLLIDQMKKVIGQDHIVLESKSRESYAKTNSYSVVKPNILLRLGVYLILCNLTVLVATNGSILLPVFLRHS